VKTGNQLKIEAWSGICQSNMQLIRRLINGEFVLMHVSKPKDTCYDALLHNSQHCKFWNLH